MAQGKGTRPIFSASAAEVAERELARRERITVGAVDCDPGRGSCRECATSYGNYHLEGCSQVRDAAR